MGLFGTGTASGDGLFGKASSAASSLFDSLRKEDGEFTYIEDEVGIPRGTLYPLMMAESEQWALQGQATPESTDGAVGPFQLLPSTARDYNANPFDLHEAAGAAAHEIKRGIKKTGSLDKALAIYNYGYGKSRKQNFDLNKIDKMQGDKETKKHRERFHKYHGEPEKNLDWMQPLMNNQQDQYTTDQLLKKWMYPKSKDGAVDKKLMYPSKKTLQESTAMAQVQPALQPFNRIVEHSPPIRQQQMQQQQQQQQQQQPSRIVEHRPQQQQNQISALEQLMQYEKMFGN